MSAVPGAAQWRGSARVIVQGIAHLWKQRRQKLGAVDAASRNFDELGTAVGVGSGRNFGERALSIGRLLAAVSVWRVVSQRQVCIA